MLLLSTCIFHIYHYQPNIFPPREFRRMNISHLLHTLHAQFSNLNIDIIGLHKTTPVILLKTNKIQERRGLIDWTSHVALLWSRAISWVKTCSQSTWLFSKINSENTTVDNWSYQSLSSMDSCHSIWGINEGKGCFHYNSYHIRMLTEDVLKILLTSTGAIPSHKQIFCCRISAVISHL